MRSHRRETIRIHPLWKKVFRQICSQSPPESPREASCQTYIYLHNLRRNIPQPCPLQHACPHRSSTTNHQPYTQMTHHLRKNLRWTKQLQVQRQNYQPRLIPLLKHLMQLQVPVGKQIPFLSLQTLFQALTNISLRRTDNTGPRSVADLAATTDIKTGTIPPLNHQPPQPPRTTEPDLRWSTHCLQNQLVVWFHSAKHRNQSPTIPSPVCQQ